MKLIIVRHAETVENKNKIMQGHIPGRLSRLGIKQAKKLCEHLKKYKIDKIYSSDLKRCKDTLKYLLKDRKIIVEYSKDLRERRYGIFEGKKFIHYHRWIKKNPNGTPSKGESNEDMQRRIDNFLVKITKNEKNRTLLIVTHGDAKRRLLSSILKRKDKRFEKRINDLNKNTAMTVINLKDNGRHTISKFYSIKHLEDLT